MARIARAELRP